MQATELVSILKELNVPVANTSFPPNKNINPPFLVFLRSDMPTFLADDFVYQYDNKYDIELYTEDKDEEIEDRLINILNNHKIVWKHIAEERIQDGLYEVVFGI